MRIPQKLFDALALGDVDSRADAAEEFATGREARRAAVEYPAILAVAPAQTILNFQRPPRGAGGAAPAQTILNFQRPPRGAGGAEQVDAALPVVGMDAF